MEAKKSKKAATENQKDSWLLMGLVVAPASMLVPFERAQYDIRTAAALPDDESVFVTGLVPITFPEERLEPPPLPEIKQSEWTGVVDNTEEVMDNVLVVSDNVNEPYKVVWVPLVVETKEVEEDVIHVGIEIISEFPGGSAELLKYLSAHIKYPAMSQEMGSQEHIIIQSVVGKDGSITNPIVIRGVDAYLDKEAIRVINGMPKWEPRVQNGEKVRVKYIVPVVFRLRWLFEIGD